MTVMESLIGTHVVRIEGDIVFLIVRGDFTLADMMAFTAIGDEHSARWGYLLILNDLAQATSLPADARRYSAQRMREARLKGPVYAVSAMIGTGLLTRGMATLYYSALRLVSGAERLSFFCANEAEARAVLAEQRSHFRAQLGLGALPT